MVVMAMVHDKHSSNFLYYSVMVMMMILMIIVS